MLDVVRADAPKGLRGREGKGEGKGVLSAIDTPDFFYHVCKLLAGRSPLSPQQYNRRTVGPTALMQISSSLLQREKGRRNFF